jgi:hypothetical protein
VKRVLPLTPQTTNIHIHPSFLALLNHVLSFGHEPGIAAKQTEEKIEDSEDRDGSETEWKWE